MLLCLCFPKLLFCPNNHHASHHHLSHVSFKFMLLLIGITLVSYLGHFTPQPSSCYQTDLPSPPRGFSFSMCTSTIGPSRLHCAHATTPFVASKCSTSMCFVSRANDAVLLLPAALLTFVLILFLSLATTATASVLHVLAGTTLVIVTSFVPALDKANTCQRFEVLHCSHHLVVLLFSAFHSCPFLFSFL